MSRKNKNHLILSTRGTSFADEIEESIGKEAEDEWGMESRAEEVVSSFDIYFEESLLMRSAFNPDFHSSPKREVCNTFNVGTV